MLKPDVLRNKKDFSAVYNKGKSAGSKYVVILYKKNHLPYSRKAFLASKKVGKSVIRNRAKRLMKESLREIEKKNPLKEGYDYIFVARYNMKDAHYREVIQSMERGLKFIR